MTSINKMVIINIVNHSSLHKDIGDCELFTTNELIPIILVWNSWIASTAISVFSLACLHIRHKIVNITAITAMLAMKKKIFRDFDL